MKGVKSHMSAENRRQAGISPRKSARGKGARKPVVYCGCPMNISKRTTNHHKANPVPEIPGVDFLAEREKPSKPIAGPFYTDQIEMLVETARAVRDRARQGLVFIAPEGVGFTIFKRRPAGAGSIR